MDGWMGEWMILKTLDNGGVRVCLCLFSVRQAPSDNRAGGLEGWRAGGWQGHSPNLAALAAAAAAWGPTPREGEGERETLKTALVSLSPPVPAPREPILSCVGVGEGLHSKQRLTELPPPENLLQAQTGVWMHGGLA